MAQGGGHVSPLMAERLARDLTVDAADLPHTHLGDREFRAPHLLATDKTVADIADTLSLSVKTIIAYRRRLLQKMRMNTNANLIHFSIQHQLSY